MTKNLLLLLFADLFWTLAECQVNPNSHYVSPYVKSNGTMVTGHYRTNPNSTINDNYSTYPNINPYTGKQGTVQPAYNSYISTYSYPTYSPNSYLQSVTNSGTYNQTSIRKNNSAYQNNAYEEVNYSGYINTLTNASIYARPDQTNARVIFVNNNREPLKIIEKYNNRYYKVQIRNITGYIFVGMISNDRPVYNQIPDNSNRYEPSVTLNNNSSAGDYLTDPNDEYYKITYSGTVQTLSNAEIYSIPDQFKGSILYVNKFEKPVTILEKVNNRYYKVAVNGITGYLFVGMIISHSANRSYSKSGQTESFSGYTTPGSGGAYLDDKNDPWYNIDYRGMVQTLTNAPIFELPDQINSKIVFVNRQQVPVRIIQKTNNRYFKVEVGGIQGYIFIGMIIPPKF